MTNCSRQRRCEQGIFQGPVDVPPAIRLPGDLAGLPGNCPAAVLQARFLYHAARRTTATVTDAAGKQYTGDLLALTDYDVSIQDAGGWYHSWPVDSVKLDVKDPLAAHRSLLTKYTDPDMHNMLAYLETLK
jgi:cytochrome c oxidase cbb3-type subunit 3